VVPAKKGQGARGIYCLFGKIINIARHFAKKSIDMLVAIWPILHYTAFN
jgi:hypothetical protein